VSTIIVTVVIVAATFGFMIFQRKKLATQYAHLRAGQLATRLGMQLLEGNPEFNPVTQSVQPSVQNTGSAGGFLRQMAASQVGGTLGEFKLHAAGQPYGHNAELVLYCRQDLETGLVQNTTTTWHDLRLTLHARHGVVPFDLRLRKEMTGMETRRRDDVPRMPAQSFGDPMLDQRYVIETPDPALPRRIAPALAMLAPHLIYVHLIGTGTQLSFVMTPTSVMASATTFEPILHVLASLAAIFEGQPMPGVLAA